MANQHAKCPHCNQRGIRWGGKRRRCVPCNNTWRIRKKKRGRKKFRRTPDRAIKYLVNREVAHLRNTSFYRRVISRDTLIKQLPWPQVPHLEPVIVIADAFLQYIEHAWHTWYCILVRPIASEDAVILEPFCRKGTEVVLGWHEAFARIPDNLVSRVKVLVCDGHTGLILEAKRHHWHIQRCQFHLIARLQQCRSRFARGFHQEEGRRIFQSITTALTTWSSSSLARSLKRIAIISKHTGSREIRRMLSGFLTNHEDYRTCLRYPEWHLPATSNTAEALIGLIRDLCRRARGFRTVRTMHRWIEALVKTRKTIKCRGNTNRID